MAKRDWGPTRRGSLGVLIGGTMALVGGVIMLVAGLAEQGQTLFAVGIGITAVGAAGTLWSSRREARHDG